MTGLRVLISRRFKNDRGREFLVRIVRKGDRYGRNDALVYEDDRPTVEFYDPSYPDPSFADRGQFISSYYARTLLMGGLGLRLHDAAEWSIDSNTMSQIRTWVWTETGGAS